MTQRTSSATITGKSPRPRRMARPPQDAATAAVNDTPAVARPSKLAVLEALLRRPGGAGIAEMGAATGWQQHSVRGAMAGALKKRGLVMTSEKVDGVRRYRAGDAA